MATDMIRLMQSLFLPSAGRVHGAQWQPAADVYRTRDGWLLKFDLAGVRPEDVELTIQGCRLTVRGTRRDSFIEKGCRCYRMEIAYSQFERSIELPGDPGRARITTEYQEGMLLVRVQTEAGD